MSADTSSTTPSSDGHSHNNYSVPYNESNVSMWSYTIKSDKISSPVLYPPEDFDDCKDFTPPPAYVSLPPKYKTALLNFLEESSRFFSIHGIRMKMHPLPLRLPEWCKGSLETVARSGEEKYPYTAVYRHKCNFPRRILSNWSYITNDSNSPGNNRNCHAPFSLRPCDKDLSHQIDDTSSVLDDPEFSGLLITLHTKIYNESLEDSPDKPIQISKVVGGALIETLVSNEQTIKGVWLHCSLSARSTRLLAQAFLPRVMVESFGLSAPLEDVHNARKFTCSYHTEMDLWPRQAFLIMASSKYMGLHRHYEQTGAATGPSLAPKGHEDIQDPILVEYGIDDARPAGNHPTENDFFSSNKSTPTHKRLDEVAEEKTIANEDMKEENKASQGDSVDGEEGAKRSGRKRPKEEQKQRVQQSAAKRSATTSSHNLVRLCKCPCWAGKRRLKVGDYERLVGCTDEFMFRTINREEGYTANNRSWRFYPAADFDAELAADVYSLIPGKNSKEMNNYSTKEDELCDLTSADLYEIQSDFDTGQAKKSTSKNKKDKRRGSGGSSGA